MKTKFLLCILTVLIISCKSTKENEFIVEASIDGVENGTKVFLKKADANKPPVSVDTVTVENGAFTIKGISEIPEIHYIFIDGIRGNIPVILEEGVVNVTVNKDTLSQTKIGGTPSNDAFYSFIKDSRAIGEKVNGVRKDMAKAQQERDTATMNALRDEYFEIREEAQNFELKYAEEHPESYVTLLLIQRYLYRNEQPVDKIKSLYDQLSDKLKLTKEAKDIQEKINDMEKVSLGSIAPDFSGPTPEGASLALNDVKGKVTIVDFWAAWCKPCRIENPNVVKLYNKYHEKGLSIIGVSLDRKAEDWKKAIEDDGLVWNHVSNLKHWQDPIAKTYNVKSIPATFILDETGTIVARDLRGEALEAKVAELLNKG